MHSSAILREARQLRNVSRRFDSLAKQEVSQKSSIQTSLQMHHSLNLGEIRGQQPIPGTCCIVCCPAPLPDIVHTFDLPSPHASS
jgi:hypothetical protein